MTTCVVSDPRVLWNPSAGHPSSWKSRQLILQVSVDIGQALPCSELLGHVSPKTCTKAQSEARKTSPFIIRHLHSPKAKQHAVRVPKRYNIEIRRCVLVEHCPQETRKTPMLLREARKHLKTSSGKAIGECRGLSKAHTFFDFGEIKAKREHPVGLCESKRQRIN